MNPAASTPVKAAIQDRIGSKTFAAWQEIFQRADVCVEPVLSIEEITKSPILAEREMVVSVPCDEGGAQKQLASPLKFSTFRPVYRHIGLKNQ